MEYNGNEIYATRYMKSLVLDKFLLAEKEQGRRRFTMAHEASHHILSKMYSMPSEGRFHAEYDSERSYSKEKLAQMFASVEWQANIQTLSLSIVLVRHSTKPHSTKQSEELSVIAMMSSFCAVMNLMCYFLILAVTRLDIRLQQECVKQE